MGFEARGVLRAARAGVLATVSDGEPQAALVTPATTASLDILLLLSELSSHTRTLATSPRCALLVSGPAADANPQTAPRVSVSGTAIRLGPGDALESARSRYLAIHPYAALYAGFTDFSVWLLRPEHAMFVGGFGRARRLAARDLCPTAAAVAAIAAEDEALRRAADSRFGQDGLVAAIDPDGLDVISGEGTQRVAYPAEAGSAEAFRAALALVHALPA